MMKRLFLTIGLAAAAAWGQNVKETQPAEPKEVMVQKLFILKHADPRAVADVIGIFGGTRTNPELHAVAVTASEKNMPAIEEAIGKLDAAPPAPKNLELTVYYLVGGGEDTPGGAVPQALESVVTQLKNTFSMKTYRLLDVIELRTRSGFGAQTNSTVGPISGSAFASPQFEVKSAAVEEDGTTVRLDHVKAGIRWPIVAAGGGVNYSDLGVNVDVDVKAGQKVVVGRIGINHDQALFLVLTARVVD